MKQTNNKTPRHIIFILKKRHKAERTQKLMGDTIHVKEQGLEFYKISYKNPGEKQQENQTKLKIHGFFFFDPLEN